MPRRLPCSAAVTALVLAGCAAAPAERSVAPGEAADCAVTCDPGADEPMLERVEGQDVQYFEVPEAGECPHDRDELPPFTPVDDHEVPEFNPARARLSNMYTGDDSLSEQTLLQHLRSATDQVFECLSLAACYEEDEIGTGEIRLRFEVDQGGTVRAVDVAASPALDRWGLVPCARRAIYDTRFPEYDGGSVFVAYTLEID